MSDQPTPKAPESISTVMTFFSGGRAFISIDDLIIVLYEVKNLDKEGLISELKRLKEKYFEKH